MRHFKTILLAAAGAAVAMPAVAEDNPSSGPSQQQVAKGPPPAWVTPSEPLPHTLIEYYLKSDELQDPMVAEEHIACFGWANNEEMQDIAAMAIRVNDFMCGMFAAIDIRLIDFKLEFGRIWDGDFARVILADEISPDNCRLWDMTSGEKLDKDRFRRDLGGEEEAYQEVARRLGILDGDDAGPGEVFDLSAHRKLRGAPKPKK